MLQRTIVVGAAAAVLFVASLASAQEQTRAQGRGGFGGFRGGNAGLLGMAEVQKELAVSDEQKGLIEDIQKDLRQQLFGGNTNPEEFRNLSQEERQKRMEEFRKKSDELNKKADEMIDILLEPKKSDR